MSNLLFRKLTLEEIHTIYYSDMVLQFPDSERRSYANIADMVSRGLYCGFGLYKEDSLCAYALLASIQDSGVHLLDYLAVPDPHKKKGFGSETLKRLRSFYPITDRILIETEDPDVLDGENSAIALRRLGFYKKNGFRETNVEIGLFSVLYRLYVNETAPDSDMELIASLEKIYRASIAPKYYDKNVSLKIRKEG